MCLLADEVNVKFVRVVTERCLHRGVSQLHNEFLVTQSFQPPRLLFKRMLRAVFLGFDAALLAAAAYTKAIILSL